MALDFKAINLGQGFPDFDPDQKLLDLVCKALNEGHNQYPAMAGVPALRQAISNKVKSLYGHYYDPATEITVTSGATEALMASITAFVRAGDEVLIIEPFYDLYLPAIELSGGVPVVVTMSPPSESNPLYSVDWNRVRDAITDKTRLLIINFPHNPTGITLKPHDLDALEQIVRDTGVLIISDEVYEHLVFDDQPHLSLATRESLAQRSLVVSSFGKTYNATGWKVGYVCAPAALSAELRKVHQFMVFTVPSPMQVALASYVADPEPYLRLPAFYQTKRDQLSEGLTNSRFKPLPSEGTFFLLADYSDISDMPQGEFSQWLTKNHGVAVIPVSAFYERPEKFDSSHRIVRFCFAKRETTLNQAIERLQGV